MDCSIQLPNNLTKSLVKTCEKPFHKISRVVENRPSCKGYSPWKGYSLCIMVSLGQKLKIPKTCEKPFYKNITVLLWKKNLSKKHQIFEKWDNFENRLSCKGYSPCRGYTLCKRVSLGQKLKIPKRCEKPFHKIIRVVLCKEIFDNFENRPSCKGPWKGYSLCKIVSLGQKVKMLKTCKTPSFKNITVVLC